MTKVTFNCILDPYNSLTINHDDFGDLALHTGRYVPHTRELVSHTDVVTLRTSQGGGRYTKNNHDLHGAVGSLFNDISCGAFVASKPSAIFMGQEVEIITLPSDDGAKSEALQIFLTQAKTIGLRTKHHQEPNKVVPVFLGNIEKSPLLENIWLSTQNAFAKYGDTMTFATREIVPIDALPYQPPIERRRHTAEQCLKCKKTNCPMRAPL